MLDHIEHVLFKSMLLILDWNEWVDVVFTQPSIKKIVWIHKWVGIKNCCKSKETKSSN